MQDNSLSPSANTGESRADRAGRKRKLPQPFPAHKLTSCTDGFASQTDSEFCRQVTDSLKRAAAAHGVHLITVNNRYSAREALRNADLLIREQVELVLEFQTYERVAPIISSKFLEAKIPVIAIEIPHPGATFFGANNYQAGLIGGRALGKWAKLNKAA